MAVSLVNTDKTKKVRCKARNRIFCFSQKNIIEIIVESVKRARRASPRAGIQLVTGVTKGWTENSIARKSDGILFFVIFSAKIYTRKLFII